ncbi:fungal-specific transcription factor domain-domain-containing protein [Clohesyomyces aquaticus]|uniref:Fungal-specific transcription factor domain-domain-containing protein n=1 Tax=Clohesyomyces aquaticus TaxID=1231657 RepID=A0A1Y1ZH57_9PLEO|nr:fungal-specific transcription factor domain-domain-containing protein [Clohesyomyces aquaticus]
MFHEPTFTQDVEHVYNGSTDPYQNFCLRMVIAISLQKMDTQYAGLADSYYLAALKFLEGSIKPMNVKTLQCFALIAGYSLLTPTRTAIYYVIGLGVRLCQALGLHEEKTISRGPGGAPLDPLEIDMRRRLFWCILTMDYGLAHSLGRPAIFAARRDHIDVNFFELVDDEYITRQGVHPAPQASLKKWIAIHFFKMRLLQLEIRRKLYQRKRPEPKDDQDPWFTRMLASMVAWRDTSPEMDGGSGLNKVWFTGRYNTMVIFLYRPSPQIPRPSLHAAVQCFEACEYNIYMHRKQIETGSVDLTWIFTQSIFMVINTILWTLSFAEIRRNHSREEVERHLSVALECIDLASARWPGVASALALYRNLIDACMKIYDKDGDIPIAAGSPSESASVTSSMVEGINRSRTTSPATASTASISTPPDKSHPPFGYLPNQDQPPFGFTSSQQTSSIYSTSPAPQSQSAQTSPRQPPPQPYIDTSPKSSVDAAIPNFSFTPTSQFQNLPTNFSDLPQWTPTFSMPPHHESFTMAPISHTMTSPVYNEQYAAGHGYPMADYLYPQWSAEGRGMGLNQDQQMELMQTFEANETSKIEAMIQQSNQLFSPRIRTY